MYSFVTLVCLYNWIKCILVFCIPVFTIAQHFDLLYCKQSLYNTDIISLCVCIVNLCLNNFMYFFFFFQSADYYTSRRATIWPLTSLFSFKCCAHFFPQCPIIVILTVSETTVKCLNQLDDRAGYGQSLK